MSPLPMPTPAPAGVLQFSGFRRSASDLKRNVDFYVGGLGFTVDRNHRDGAPLPGSASAGRSLAGGIRLVLGGESIELFSAGDQGPLVPAGQHASVADVAFHHIAIVTNDMGQALERLARYAPTPISTDGAVRLPESAGGVTAFKFRDPDGHPLELIQFPATIGDARWQHAAGDGPTLGIDHSAIAVLNVERSLAFYVGALGFQHLSRQVNRGSAQAALDGTPGAEVEVVGLSPRRVATPHLELLGYRTPVPVARRALPPLIDDPADQMTFLVDDLPAAVAQLDTLFGAATDRWSAPGAVLLRDADGHVLLLRSSTPRPAP